MNYGEVLSRAWQIIWKYKVLWIFGILASCAGAGNSGASNSGFRFSSGDWPVFERQFVNLPNWLIATIVGTVILIVIVLVILAILLGTIGRVGLVRGAQLAEQGQDRLIFGELFSYSMGFFWRIFGLYLISAIIVPLIVIFIGIPISIITCGIGVLALIFFLIMVPVILEQSANAIVIENVGLIEGFQRGWNLVFKNLGVMIVMGLILVVVIGIISAVVLGLPLSLFILPPVIGAIIGGKQATYGGLATSAVCFVIFLPVLFIISGIIRSYVSASWTLTYLRLTGRPPYVEPEPALEPGPTPTE